MREYFYKKYKHIVDNPKIGKELEKVWALAGTITTNEMMKLVTGKTLSPEALIKDYTDSIEGILQTAKQCIAATSKAKQKISVDAKVKKSELDKRIKARVSVV